MTKAEMLAAFVRGLPPPWREGMPSTVYTPEAARMIGEVLNQTSVSEIGSRIEPPEVKG